MKRILINLKKIKVQIKIYLDDYIQEDLVSLFFVMFFYVFSIAGASIRSANCRKKVSLLTFPTTCYEIKNLQQGLRFVFIFS